jgi:hypothetical protein
LEKSIAITWLAAALPHQAETEGLHEDPRQRAVELVHRDAHVGRQADPDRLA